MVEGRIPSRKLFTVCIFGRNIALVLQEVKTIEVRSGAVGAKREPQLSFNGINLTCSPWDCTEDNLRHSRTNSAKRINFQFAPLMPVSALILGTIPQYDNSRPSENSHYSQPRQHKHTV